MSERPKQTAAGELAAELAGLEARTTYYRSMAKACETAQTLIGAYRKTGCMSVMLPNKTRMDKRDVEHGGSDVQHAWNVCRHAAMLAGMSHGLSHMALGPSRGWGEEVA